MRDEADPPRKHYQFKPREFEVVNEPARQPPPSSLPPPSEPAPAGSPDQKIEISELYRQAGVPGPLLQREHPTPRNEVHTILQDNLARANAAGANELKPQPKRRYRRTRDFFLIVVPLDAFFALAAFSPYSSPSMMVYGLSGMVLATVGLAWIMFVVMEKY